MGCCTDDAALIPLLAKIADPRQRDRCWELAQDHGINGLWIKREVQIAFIGLTAPALDTVTIEKDVAIVHFDQRRIEPVTSCAAPWNEIFMVAFDPC